MKTKLFRLNLFIYFCLLPFTAFAGPEPIAVVTPTPAPSAMFKAHEFDVAAFALGAWPISSHQTDQYLQSANAFGGAISAKYFAFDFSGVQIGAGLDTNVLRARAPSTNADTKHRAVVLSDANIVARYPIGSFAPFVSIGLGAATGGGYDTQFQFTTPVKKFNAINDTKFDWTATAGVEYRLTKNWGIIGDVSWNDLGPKKNFVSPRLGLNFAF